jgi:precorrin-8X/cobalt-precorrin-8 methylmutase
MAVRAVRPEHSRPIPPSSIETPILQDHPIFLESLRLIRAELAERGVAGPTDPLERAVLERCIHSSGDLSIAADLRFSPGACAAGAAALAAGGAILTDTAMAAAAVAPMAARSFANPVHSVLAWAPARAPEGSTRTAVGMEGALAALGPGLVVLVGSAPTALERLLELVAAGAVPAPALVIGMPVGFVGVAESKRHLGASGLAQVRLEGSRGGAALVGAACNALLRAGCRQAAS